MQYEPSSQQHVPAPYVPAQQFRPHQAGWSALAITAFVCSLLGFLGFTAILGIIFGIAGIVAARGGRKRGMGLAIAAIPISLVTGVVSLLIVFGIVVGMRYMEIHAALRPALSAEDPSSAEAIANVRKVANKSFNDEVSDAQLSAWLKQVRETHGRLVDLDPDQATPPRSGVNGIQFNLAAKFVNGPQTVHLSLTPEGALSMRFDDIDIGGVSPRDLKEP